MYARNILPASSQIQYCTCLTNSASLYTAVSNPSLLQLGEQRVSARERVRHVDCLIVNEATTVRFLKKNNSGTLQGTLVRWRWRRPRQQPKLNQLPAAHTALRARVMLRSPRALAHLAAAPAFLAPFPGAPFARPAPRRAMSSRPRTLATAAAAATSPPAREGPTHGERARGLLARARAGTLATLEAAGGGPYASLVAYALLEGGDFVVCVSELAEHTRNLRADGRCSLCVAEEVGAAADPLARGRVTLAGVAAAVEKGGAEEAACRAAFLARNPRASRYVGFGDFFFWRGKVEKVRYIGGFGRMSFVSRGAWAEARPDPVACDDGADALVARLNEPATVARLAALIEGMGMAGVSGVTGVVVRAVDRLGVEVDVATEGGGQPMRVAFERPAAALVDAEALVEVLLKKQSIS